MTVLFLFDKGNNPYQQAGADDSGYDMSYNCSAPMNAEPAEDIAPDEASDDTENEVDEESEATAFHDFAGQESGQCAT